MCWGKTLVTSFPINILQKRDLVIFTNFMMIFLRHFCILVWHTNHQTVQLDDIQYSNMQSTVYQKLLSKLHALSTSCHLLASRLIFKYFNITLITLDIINIKASQHSIFLYLCVKFASDMKYSCACHTAPYNCIHHTAVSIGVSDSLNKQTYITI